MQIRGRYNALVFVFTCIASGSQWLWRQEIGLGSGCQCLTYTLINLGFIL